DAEPSTAEEIAPMQVAERMGYLAVGMRIDTEDWQAKVTPEDMVKKVVALATDADPEKRGQVILMHDSGGEPARPRASLPKIIDALRDKGLDFVTVSELARWSKDQAMPPVPADEAAPLVNRYVFFTLSWFQNALTSLFLLAIGLGIVRLAVLCGLALAGKAREKRRALPSDAEGLSVSVLIPAFNEAKVIGSAVRHIL